MSGKNGTQRNGTAPSHPTGDNDGREASGRFAQGNRLGKRFEAGNRQGRGNPFYRKQAALRQALLDEVGEDGLRELVRKLREQALAGDVATARTLLAYAVGKPGAAADPDAVDENEWQKLRRLPCTTELLRILADNFDVVQSMRYVEEALAESQDAEAFKKLLVRRLAALKEDPYAGQCVNVERKARAAAAGRKQR
jgi:hypothetical protein